MKNDTREKVVAGFSMEDSISFVTRGYIVSSIRLDNGDMYSVAFKKSKEDSEKLTLTERIYSLIILFIEIMISLLLQREAYILFGGMRFVRCLEIAMLILVLLLLYMGVTQFQKREVACNHGAEHKVFNAAAKAKRVPTLDEAKKASRFSQWCGVKIFTLSIFFLIINIVLTFFNLPVIPVLVITRLCLTLPAFDPFSYAIQMFFTTREPSEEQLRLSLNGYKTAYEIASGREVTNEETPAENKLFEYLSSLDEYLANGGEMDEKIEKSLETFTEKIKKENEIIENVKNAFLWLKKRATEKLLFKLLKFKY